MNMFDEAKSLKIMLEARKMTQKELAKSLGVSPSYVANKLRLLSHTETMQKTIIENAVSERHARALLRIEDISERYTMLSRIINEKLSVERTEALISIVTSREAVHFLKTESRTASVARFLDNLKSSCEFLASQGVDVIKSVRYSDNKLRIYITIDEE